MSVLLKLKLGDFTPQLEWKLMSRGAQMKHKPIVAGLGKRSVKSAGAPRAPGRSRDYIANSL